ncbi:histidine kinase [Synechococcus sp. PCC 7502]|uniref:sensor histidine kinase n=1 Tax=Synechococcus sp. PCC 7502 TaxID=1173263 RepID=UPI00029FE57C|nr:HAMP domain-containing sensor histidine kinase [Synechococcus sp. PCC 7502]AFY75328.1 histidine kinase [Synechococcus sp. PCC 7502]
MPINSLYDALEGNQFVETIYQTPRQEYWLKAIITLRQFWNEISSNQTSNKSDKGIFLTNSPQLLSRNFYGDLSVQAWFFTANQSFLFPPQFQAIQSTQVVQVNTINAYTEYFLILATNKFAILLISSDQKFLFSLHPDAIAPALSVIKSLVSDHVQARELEQNLQNFRLVVPPYQVISKFALALLTQSFQQELPIPEIKEVDIIKAIAHEVKTPLTTIRTLVQSLLRRQDVSQIIRNRLEKIDFECQDQIGRFNLIFEIVNLNRQVIRTEPTSLGKILDTSLSLWQQQAQRRHLSIEVVSLNPLPVIITNRQLLTQLLNSIVDRITRSIPAGSHIRISINIAGKYVKLQFKSDSDPTNEKLTHKALGQWLMLQPETGTLSLSLMISKVLFELIGGKLTIRNHPTIGAYDGELLTIFLVLNN